MSDFEFINIEDFQQAIKEVVSDFPKTSEKHLRKCGNELKKKAIENTPVGQESYDGIEDDKERKKAENKRMKNKWRGKITYKGTMPQYELRNASPVYHLVERGHVQKSKKGEVTGFVQGQHFFEKTEKEYAQSDVIDNEMGKFMDDINKKI